ncbi:hypothetical protein OKW35_001687 [Paraburkholderia sp. MM5477-R1]
MTKIAGTLEFVNVKYIRTSRYRRRGQTESHRAPRYKVRYRVQGQPPRVAMVEPKISHLIVSRIRESQPGDRVEVALTTDEQNIVEWTNQTQDTLWEDFSGTFGESDDTSSP